MTIPKIGPSGGRGVQTTSTPAGQVWKKTKTVGKKALDNAIFKKVKMTVQEDIPNLKEAEKSEKIAFRFFEKTNEDHAKP